METSGYITLLCVFLTHPTSLNVSTETCDSVKVNSYQRIINIKSCILNQSKLRDWATGGNRTTLHTVVQTRAEERENIN